MRKIVSVLMSICLCICAVLVISGCKKDELSISFYVADEVYATVITDGKSEVTLPEDPTKTGYDFEGWFYDKDVFEKQFEKDSLTKNPIEDNLNVYANYKAIEYTATFKNGTEVVDTKTFTIEDTEIDDIPDVPTKENYDGVWENYEIGTNDIEINAVYTLIEYEIKYNLDGGLNNSANPETYNVEDGTINLKSPTKEGKTFNGWELDDEFVESFSSSLVKNITLVATWIDEVELTYTKDSDENITLTGFADSAVKSTLRVLEIGETYDGYKVARIAMEAFSYCSALQIVTISNSVENIGEKAFLFCTDLTKVDYLGTIEQWCRITFDSSYSNPLYYGRLLYLNGVLVDNLVIPDTITNIKENAFYNCTSLKSVTIPNSVESIGECAFFGCASLINIEIPNSVESIGEYAFSNCSNLEYNVIDNVNYLGNDDNKYIMAISVTDKTSTEYTIHNTTKFIACKCFSTCNNLESIKIPGSVKSIGDCAFYNCTSLANITIPDSIESIGDYAFYYCTSLENITIPNSVESIGNYAFYNCTILANITMRDGVKSIGANAFYNCTSLENITIPNSVESIGYDVFYGCSNLIYNSIENIEYLGNDINPHLVAINAANKTLESYKLQDTTKVIVSGCFSTCRSLERITIPDSVKSIGLRAFSGCTNLRDVYIESDEVVSGIEAVDSFGEIIKNATTIYIEKSITTIGSYITDNYTKELTTTVNDVTYNIYTKNK